MGRCLTGLLDLTLMMEVNSCCVDLPMLALSFLALSQSAGILHALQWKLCCLADGSGEQGHQAGEQLVGWIQEAAAEAV